MADADAERIEAIEALRARERQRPLAGATFPDVEALRRREGNPRAQMVGQMELGPPGLEDPGARFGLAQANNYKEALAAFTLRYPQGELFRDPVDGQMLFRTDPSKLFAKVDAGILEKFEPLGDIIDFAAKDLGAIAGDVAATFRTRGMNLIPRLMRHFTGTVVGEMGQQGGQELAGLNTESAGEMTMTAAGKGAFSVGGAGVGALVGRGIEGIRGAGSLTLKPQAEVAIEASKRAGLPQMMPQQVADSPILERFASQSAAVLPHLNRYMRMQNDAIQRYLKSGPNQRNAAALRTEMQRVYDEARKDILSLAANPGTDARTAGMMLQTGLKQFDDFARNQVDDAYATARSIETPKFDLSGVIAAANELERGVPFTTTKGTVGSAAGGLAPELQNVIKTVRQIDPAQSITTIEGKNYSLTDAFKTLRSRLWDLKTPNPGELFREEHRQANIMYKALTETMDNPVNANPTFVNAWRDASKKARDRFDVWDTAVISQVAKSETPAQLARRLAQPNQVDNLEFLKGVLPADKYRGLQDFVKTELMNEPEKLSRNLARFDQTTLDRLMPRAEQATFKQVGQRIDALNALGLQRTLAKQTEFGKIVMDAARRKDSAQTEAMFQIIMQNGGKEGPLGTMIRAGIMDNVVRETTTRKSGDVVKTLDNRAIQNMMANLAETGLTRFLTFGDLRRLQTVSMYSSLAELGQDFGASLQAAERVSGLRAFNLRALHTVMEMVGVGRLLTSEWGNKFLIGTGKSKSTHDTLKDTASVLGILASDFRGAEDGAPIPVARTGTQP